MRPPVAAPGESQNSFGEDVALDLGRPRVDRLRLRPHPAELPASVLDRVRRVGRQGPIWTLNTHRRLLDALVHLAPVKLGHARFWSRSISVLCTREAAQPYETEDMSLDLGLRNLLPNRGVGTGAAIAREARQLLHRSLESGRLGEATPFAPEHGHRNLPTRARLADQVAVLDHRVSQEDLAELTAPGHLADRPDLDSRLVQVDEEERDPLVSLGLAISARQQEALVGIVRAARPSLLSVEDPVPIASLGARAQPGQVAARVGFAEALAEDELAAEDLLDVLVLLPGRTVGEERRSEKAHAKPSKDHRSTRLGHLLVVDRLHDRARRSSPGLKRP